MLLSLLQMQFLHSDNYHATLTGWYDFSCISLRSIMFEDPATRAIGQALTLGAFFLGRHLGKNESSDSDQLNRRVVDDYHSGNWQTDPDEQARVQAYFAELDRRRAASGDPRYAK